MSSFTYKYGIPVTGKCIGWQLLTTPLKLETVDGLRWIHDRICRQHTIMEDHSSGLNEVPSCGLFPSFHQKWQKLTTIYYTHILCSHSLLQATPPVTHRHMCMHACVCASTITWMHFFLPLLTVHEERRLKIALLSLIKKVTFSKSTAKASLPLFPSLRLGGCEICRSRKFVQRIK